MLSYRLLSVVAVAVVVIIASCVIPPLSRASSATVWDSNNNQWVTPAAMTRQLTTARYVVIGEMYQSLSMRDQLLNALESLKHAGWLEVLAIDALKPEIPAQHQSYLEQLDSAPATLAEHFRPFVIWANQQDDMVLLGTALPPDKLASMKSPEGLTWLAEQTRGALSEKRQKYLQKVLAETHSQSEIDYLTHEYTLAAQQLIDYFMARTVTLNPQNTVLLTKTFHARKDLGVEPYIKNLEPGAKVVSVLMLGPFNGRQLISHQIDELQEYYDYIWLQEPEELGQ